MTVTKEDIEAFKELVTITKKNAYVIATALVEAGVAKWKPNFEPKPHWVSMSWEEREERIREIVREEIRRANDHS